MVKGDVFLNDCLIFPYNLLQCYDSSMGNSSTIASEFGNKPVSHNAPPDPASELLRQGNKFARDEQFSDAERVFRAAVSLPSGKAIWNEKPLGFCLSLFPDASCIDAYSSENRREAETVINALEISGHLHKEKRFPIPFCLPRVVRQSWSAFPNSCGTAP